MKWHLKFGDFVANYSSDDLSLHVYDCDGDMMAAIPMEECPSLPVFAAMCRMYQRGEAAGKIAGRFAVQQEIRKTLGL